MPLNIPPLQWPKIYNMVNLGGIDLATANGSVVPGIYQKITTALTSDHIEVFYNWKFADIVLPPSKVVIDVSVANQYTINEEILVKSDDTVGIIGFIRIPVIIPLTAEENKVYNIPTGADGFGPVTVQVPIPTPTLVSLNVTENGDYQPSTGEDGFSEVHVAVPQPSGSLSITQNGTYNVTMKEEVIVNVVTEWESITSQATFSSPFSLQAGSIIKGGEIVLVNICLHATAAAASRSVIFTLPNMTADGITYMLLNDKGTAVTCYAYNDNGLIKIIIDDSDAFTKRTEYPVLIGYIKLT